jgi:cytochrome c oxidase cbb3-type subunit 2
MQVLKKLGVPYTDEDFASVKAAVEGKTEMEAVIEYLQSLKYVGPVDGAAKGQP